jgi:hypothetical protein
MKSWFGSDDSYQPSGKFVCCMDCEEHMLPTINKIQELVRRTRWSGLGFRGPFNGNSFTNFTTLPSSEIFARKAQNIGTLGLGAHGHRRMQMDELCLSSITSTRKGVHLFIFILIS